MTNIQMLKDVCAAADLLPAPPTLLGEDNSNISHRGGFAALLEELQDLEGAAGHAVATVADEIARWLLPSLPEHSGMMDNLFGRLERQGGTVKAPHPIELWYMCMQKQ